jgi:hypothetical protein
MEAATIKIENLYTKMKQVFKELSDLMKVEMTSITEIDVDSLWRFAEKKKELSLSIENIRGQILEVLTTESLEHNMTRDTFDTKKILTFLPGDSARKIRRIHTDINCEADRINRIATENIRYANDYLEGINEIMEVLTGSGEEKVQTYGRNQYSSAGATRKNVLISREA